MHPYSDRIIFFDSEFTWLNPRTSEFLSVGFVTYDGRELYLEFKHSDDMDPWVKERVLPHLTGEKISKQEGVARIKEFFGDEKPYLVAYVNQFDSVLWYDLFGSAQEHPAYWIPIDFASMLFAYGHSPASMGKHEFLSSLGINMESYDERPHHALSDAKLLREVYLAFERRYRGGEG